MPPIFEYRIPVGEDDVRALGQILSQCFNSPPTSESTFLSRIGADNLRILHQAGQIVGGLALLPMGQWYGFRCVPMTGIAGVGILPEYRGAGAAIALMHYVVKELHANGVPISVLYPATQRLYRKAGYEQGGSLCTWEIATNDIQLRDYSLPVQRISPDASALMTLYRQQAQTTNGYLERHSAIWRDIIEQKDGAIAYTYRIGAESNPEGYLVFNQRHDRNGGLIVVRDWVLLTPVAVRRFWTFLADHRSQIETIRWRSSPTDVLTLSLPEQSARLYKSERWMLRIINGNRALTHRRYPTGVHGELHVQIRDELLPDNNGNFILRVADGQGDVISGGTGELKLNVRGLSSLYTGLFTPFQLQLMGQLNGTDSSLAIATQLFANPSPWMADFF